MIGLTGPNGTGKSTLAQAFASAEGIPFVATSGSDVFRRMGLDPKKEYPFDLRLAVQEMILGAFEIQYRQARKLSNLFVADRTPIDLASYLLADIRRSDLVDKPELARLAEGYVARCLRSAGEHFSVIVQVQPGIQVPMLRDGKAPSCPAYMEHLNAIQLGLLCDERNPVRRYSIPRRVLDLDDRVAALRQAVSAVIEAEAALKKSRVYH